MLELTGVSFRFPGNERYALDHVSLTVAPGQRICLLGHNGSGKTTVTRIASGELVPTGGTVLVDGSPCDEPGCGGAVAVVGQDAREQATCLLVEEEVAFTPHCQLLSPSEIEERVDRALAACDIEHLRERSLDELSGGQMQLVAIAAALAAQPKYLLLDEACSHLDKHSREQVAHVIERVRGRGVGILQVTHDPRDVVGADKVIELAAGQVSWQGSSHDWLERQRHARIDAPGAEEVISNLQFMQKQASEGLFLRSGTASYGKEVVFRDLSVSVSAGELVILCGPSGSGKSTLAHVLAGVHPLDAGEALLGKRRVVAGRVGLAFQRPEDQLFASTVWDDVAYGPRNLGVDEEDVAQRVEQSLRAFGVPDELWQAHAQTLSGGMRRRVALASIVSLEPGAFVLDEPTAGLDAEARELLHQVIGCLRDADCPVLLVTHDPEEWEHEATRTIDLEKLTGRKTAEPTSQAMGSEALVRGVASKRGRSMLGSIDARVRFAAALLLTIGLFGCQRLSELLIAAAAVALVMVLGRTSWRDLRTLLLPATPLLTLVFLSNALRFDGSGDRLLLGSLGVSMDGLSMGLIAVVRILCLVGISAALASDLSSTDVMKMVRMLLAPFERLGLPVADISMVLSVTLTLIPQTYDEFLRIECAQRARGAQFDTGPIWIGLRNWAAVMVPLVVVLFGRSDMLARAMRLRGYRGKMSIETASLSRRDWLALLASIAISAFLLLA